MSISVRARALAGAAIALALLATACGGAAATDDGQAAAASSSRQVTIKLESYIPTIGQGASDTLDSMVQGFEKAHPNVHVTVSSPPSSTATAITSNLQREEVAGTAPDLTQVSFDALKFMVSSLGAQSLDKVVGRSQLQAEFGGDHPYAAPVTKLGVVGGRTYGIPWTLSTPVLFYNADLFKAAGLDPSTPPKTWDEVAQDAATIKARTGADGLGNGCVGAAASGSDWCLQAIIRSAGGDVLSSDGKQVSFTNGGATRALTTMQKLTASGAQVDLTAAQTAQAFGSGKLAMVLQTSALQSTLLNAAGGRFSVLNTGMPAFPGQTVRPTNSGSALFMLTRDRAKQQAAWQLIRWLTSDASETAISEHIGYPPLRPTLANDPKYLQSWAHAQALLPANLAQLEKLVPWRAYPGPNFAQIESLLATASAKVVFQKAGVTSTMSEAQSQARGLTR